jgi:hypothetical protein
VPYDQGLRAVERQEQKRITATAGYQGGNAHAAQCQRQPAQKGESFHAVAFRLGKRKL